MKIGVIGLGTVGYGVVEILTNEKTRLEKELKQEIDVKYGCGLEEVDLPKEIIYTKDYHDVINDEEIDVVVELIGGTTIAKNIILEALNNKNKNLFSYISFHNHHFRLWCIMSVLHSRSFWRLLAFTVNQCLINTDRSNYLFKHIRCNCTRA